MTEKNGPDIAIFINGRIVTSANFASRCSLPMTYNLILCPTYAAEHAPGLCLCPELPGEWGRHPGLQARLPVQVSSHHVALRDMDSVIHRLNLVKI